MKTSLYTKLAMFFISVSIATIIVTSVIANLSTGITFRNYVTQEQKKHQAIITDTLQASYEQTGGFAADALEKLSMYAMMENLNLKIEDNSGNTVWSVEYLNHHPGLLHQPTPPAGQAARYIENKVPILSGGSQVGMLVTGFNGASSMTSRDIAFISALNRWLVVSGVLSAALAFLLSTTVSRHFSLPIRTITAAARRIRDGDLRQRLRLKTDTAEIAELSDTINHLAESLEHQESLRKQLTSDVAHELRTPLAILQSQTEAILDGLWEPTRERIEQVHNEIIRLSHLVNDLNRLTQAESAAVHLQKARFNLTAVLSSAVRSFEAEAAGKGIRLDLADTAPVDVFADKDKISQVIVNLLSNAIKYTDAGTITLSIRRTADAVQFSVRDTGIGIEPGLIPLLFERFYRVDTSRSRSTGGAGLGLAIVHSIVKAHNGTVDVQSEPGRGSVFTVTLPQVGQP